MSDITRLIARLKEGSRSAYRTLFQAYYPGQVDAARRRLRVGGLADAEDVALSVFHSLWREIADGRRIGDGLTGRESLLRTLTLLTSQKVRRARRHDERDKRDSRRTIHGTDLVACADPAPPPDWRACFRETWADLTDGLTPLQRAIVELKLAGHTNTEIADRVGRSERTIERQLSEIRSNWEERTD